jgi:hypothetical protein
MLDRENPVVRLCIAGMECEGKGELDKTRALFEQAWVESTNSFDSCIAAHYVARHQATPADALHWNQIALDRADEVETDDVRGFYASLYLNLGKSHEDLADATEAARIYRLAEAAIEALPEGPYRDMVRDGATRGLERVKQSNLPDGETPSL